MALFDDPAFLYEHLAGAGLALAAAGIALSRLVLADPPYTLRGQNDEATVAETPNRPPAYSS